MKIIAFIFCLITLFSCSKNNTTPIPPIPVEDSFIRGADLSFLPEIEEYNIPFYNQDGSRSDLLSIFKNNGCNTIRVRLWYNPSTAHSSLPEVAAFAKNIQLQGLKVLLDIHYSDTWADPGHQTTPAAWATLDEGILTDSVYAYTKRVINIIQPNYVQIGNEINGGLLWNRGSINNTTAFIRLLKSGIQASRDAKPDCKIIIHYAGIDGADYFYTLLQTNNVNYDIIGLSYYPMWHGFNINTLASTLQNLATKTGKEIMIAETSYPFTLNWNDNTNNILGLNNQLISDYPATPSGQFNFIKKIRQTIEATINGIGFCYWGAEYVAFKGPTSTDGSSYENQALFDFNNKALPAMEIFKK